MNVHVLGAAVELGFLNEGNGSLILTVEEDGALSRIRVSIFQTLQ